jgi:hypothetical protein
MHTVVPNHSQPIVVIAAKFHLTPLPCFSGKLKIETLEAKLKFAGVLKQLPLMRGFHPGHR